MSGLAAHGTLIGGGAVASLVVLGAAPGLVSIGIMNRALRADDDLLQAQRTARAIGRASSIMGAIVESAGTAVAVSALGVPA